MRVNEYCGRHLVAFEMKMETASMENEKKFPNGNCFMSIWKHYFGFWGRGRRTFFTDEFIILYNILI